MTVLEIAPALRQQPGARHGGISSMQDKPIPVGYCQCGCGQATKIAAVSNKVRGMVRGQPLNFVHGHNARKAPGPEYVVNENGCWVWQKCIARDNGYGRKGAGGSGRTMPAHRWYYEQAKGSVPDGMELDHLCRNRACVNPDHLEAVSHAANCQRGSWSRLTAQAVRHIRASSATHAELARTYGVTPTTIIHVRKRKTWKEV